MKGIFLDLETNGLDPYSHAPIEIACICVNLHDMSPIFEYSSFIKMSKREWAFRDLSSMLINEIEFSDVLKAPSAFSVGCKIIDLFVSNGVNRFNSVFICQNPSFDRMFFTQIVGTDEQEKVEMPYHWFDLGSMAWMRYFAKHTKYIGYVVTLSKDNIARQFGIPPEEKPHRAMNGVKHLMECYKALVQFS